MTAPTGESRPRPVVRIVMFVLMAAALACVVGVEIREARQESDIAHAATDLGSVGSVPGATKSSQPLAIERLSATQPIDAEKAKVARAMDLNVIRGLVVQLKLGAATGDQRATSSSLRALGRYGSTAIPILEEHLTRAESTQVRGALEQAMAVAHGHTYVEEEAR